ncbi:hypothetical protein KY338_01305 [Candidatus Woesearchaeota archaeon]|nr:hypothetical protein [Candidatus Woesearchaeota archaeon]MBW3006046.1 hypothetical protein [Candidatus Woesearchaeota archaeon]
MVQQSLTEYINKLLKAGYTPGAIRSNLINSGYSPAEINQAFTYLKKPKRKISLTLKVLIIAAISLTLLILIILGAVWLFTPEPKEISITITPLKTESYPGDTVSFLAELTSNVERIEQVLLSHELIDIKEEKIITAKQDRPEIGRKRSLTIQMNLPSDLKPGTYEIKTIMSYKLGTKQKKFNFNILEASEEEKLPEEYIEEFIEEEEPQEVMCPKSCDDFNPCTADSCEKGLCVHTPIIPCCGNGICEEGENMVNCAEDCAKTTKTPQEIITQANTVAKTDPEAAAMLCNKLTRQNDINLCFSEVAKTSGKSIICDNIQTQDSKDSCYMEFAIDGDYSVCSKIKNSYLSKSCNSLERSSIMLAQAEKISEEFKQSPE